jgi:large conductance mechanosensitive channel
MKGFKTFLLRGNVVDLAVAVIMGVAFNNIVQALVKDVITPLIAAAGGRPDFGKLVLTVGSTNVRYGLFLNAVIAFLIVATVIYFLLVAPMGKLVSFAQRKQEATEKDCPECLSPIPVKATRCKYCTAVLPPATPTAVSAASS